jgi:hypothetical protein
MKYALALTSAIVVCLTWTVSAQAEAIPRPDRSSTTLRAEPTFRLKVAGDPGRHATFWVSYGPLNGRFGIFQLLPMGDGRYEAHPKIRLRGRTDLYYLMGHGSIATPLGREPGGTVITIRHVGPVLLSLLHEPTVSWEVPVG